MAVTCYDVLGISSNATREQIIEAHKKLAKKYHPDLMLDKSPQEIKRSEEIMKQINAAKDEALAKLNNPYIVYNQKYDFVADKAKESERDSKEKTSKKQQDEETLEYIKRTILLLIKQYPSASIDEIRNMLYKLYPTSSAEIGKILCDLFDRETPIRSEKEPGKESFHEVVDSIILKLIESSVILLRKHNPSMSIDELRNLTYGFYLDKKYFVDMAFSKLYGCEMPTESEEEYNQEPQNTPPEEHSKESLEEVVDRIILKLIESSVILLRKHNPSMSIDELRNLTYGFYPDGKHSVDMVFSKLYGCEMPTKSKEKHFAK